MAPLTTCRAPAQTSPVSTQCQLSVNWYQLASSWLSLHSVKKSPFQLTLQEKWRFGCLWFRSRTRAYNKLSEAEQFLSLFQFNLFFAAALYQSSSSNLPCKLKSTKVTTDQSLDKARFLVIAHRKLPFLYS